jgi:hypothetical protein
MYVGDVGEARYEEVDVVPAGGSGFNYGWWRMEGLHCVEPDCLPDGFTPPILEYEHVDGACSVIGGFVYRGCAMPALHGAYFYGDYCAGFVRSFIDADGVATAPRDWTTDLQPDGRRIDRITSFGQDTRGELYVCDRDGDVFKLVPES